MGVIVIENVTLLEQGHFIEYWFFEKSLQEGTPTFKVVDYLLKTWRTGDGGWYEQSYEAPEAVPEYILEKIQ